MFLSVNVDKKPMLPLISQAIDQVFHEPKDIFWNGRVMDILFDGIPIDCSADSFQATAICSVFESGEVNAVKKYNDTHYSFSLFSAVCLFRQKYSHTLLQSISFFYTKRRMERIWVNLKCFVV